MTPPGRIYVGTFTIAEATVIVDLHFSMSLLGPTLRCYATLIAGGESDRTGRHLPDDLIDEDGSMADAARVAVVFAIDQARFYGHAGEVAYVHHGIFHPDDLDGCIHYGNVHSRIDFLATSQSVH